MQGSHLGVQYPPLPMQTWPRRPDRYLGSPRQQRGETCYVAGPVASPLHRPGHRPTALLSDPREVVCGIRRQPVPAAVLPHGEDPTIRAGAAPCRPERQRLAATLYFGKSRSLGPYRRDCRSHGERRSASGGRAECCSCLRDSFRCGHASRDGDEASIAVSTDGWVMSPTQPAITLVGVELDENTVGV